MPEHRRPLLVAGLLCAVLALVSGCGTSSTPSHVRVTELGTAKTGALSLTAGWVLAPEGATADMSDMPGMSHDAPMVAVYGTFHNDGPTSDALVRVLAPRGAHAQLHTTTQGATSGTMKEVGRLEVPAGGVRTLMPGGAHVMLTGLHRVPTPGSTVALTFVFRSGARIAATLPVLSAAERPAS